MKTGSTVHILRIDENALNDQLPAGVYSIAHSQAAGFYLDIIKDQLDVPTRIYGGTLNRVHKCLETYKDRKASTGILLTGDKGTGKTLLMSLLANKAITELGLPVLLIRDPFSGSDFSQFVEQIGECIMVFDEFGKMYKADTSRGNNDGEVPQKALLSLMDGVDKTKRMFILTENSEYDISEFMLNRPSRLYYHFKYKKLDEESVVGYCEDRGVSKETLRDVLEVSRRSKMFSFDMLQSIVEEQLRFEEKIADVIKDLNIDLREERGEQIEIIKVMERESGNLREMFDLAYINMPTQGNYTYAKVKNLIDQPSELSRALSTVSHVIDVPDELMEDFGENDLYDEVYIQYADLAYETNSQLIYETEEYVFVAKRVPGITTNYQKYF